MRIVLITLLITFSIGPEVNGKGPNKKPVNYFQFGDCFVALPGKGGSTLTFQNTYLPSCFEFKHTFKVKFFGSLGYFSHEREDDKFVFSDEGKVLRTNFKTIELGFGKIYSENQFRLFYCGSFGYRWGTGQDVLTQYISSSYPTPDVVTIERTRFDSFGFGLKSEVDYVLFERITIGLSSAYMYFFEKSFLKTNHLLLNGSTAATGQDLYYDFEVNKQVFIIQLKIGACL